MGKNNVRVFCAAMFALCVLLSLPLAAQDNNTYIQHAVRFAVSPPLRELAKLPQPPQYGFHEANPVRRIPKRPAGPVVDTVEQSSVAGGSNYAIGLDFLGVGNGFPGYSVPDAPPDPNIAVGDSQVVQWVNVSYAVFDKISGKALTGAILANTLWSSLGGTCATNNSGDPIAQWDAISHRWLLSQNTFIGVYTVCVAVSTSNDATGSYYLYQFPVVNKGFPDYPKWGAWTNDYGQTWNNFGPGGGGYQGPVFCIYNRAKLLAGDGSAEQICHQYTTHDDSLLPADRDSTVAPPAGEDHFAIGGVNDIDNSHLSLYSAHINNPNDWSQGATFTGDNNSQLIAVAPYNGICGSQFGGACVPQKGTTDRLDSLGDRLMYRFAYWEDQPLANVRATPPKPVPSQHWLVNHSVEASGGNGAVRWYEFTAPIKNVPVTSLSVFQQGTYAPDQQWRWMGSIARDKLGDILVGYSESSSSEYPSIYVAGRQVNDPIGFGNLESEVLVVAGAGSQEGTSGRWGDYTSMRIDLNDGMNGCTFWYTNEYYMTTASFDWSTQITSAKFENCN